MVLPECQTVLDACVRRIRTWRTPPHWSARDWFEEVGAIADAASCQAACDFDYARGIPFGAFVRQRVLANALTRYRQEWTYALHSAPAGDADEHANLKDDLLGAEDMQECLCYALARLPEVQQTLLHQLFWEERTEAVIARQLGISQRGVSKRKQAVLVDLRRRLETSQKG